MPLLGTSPHSASGITRLLAITAMGAATVLTLGACTSSDSGSSPSTTTVVSAPTSGAQATTSATRSTTTEEAPEQVSAFNLSVGDCLATDLEGEEGIGSVDVVPCAQEHSQEVYAVADLEDGDFPGEVAVQEASREACLGDTFEGFVGLPYDDSEILANFLYPTEESWEQGDREVVCLAFEDGIATTGTLEGANR